VQEHAKQAPKKMGERIPMLCSNSIRVVFLPRRSEIHHRYLMFVFACGSDVPNGRREASERNFGIFQEAGNMADAVARRLRIVMPVTLRITEGEADAS
jgi:hypothetical protein